MQDIGLCLGRGLCLDVSVYMNALDVNMGGRWVWVPGYICGWVWIGFGCGCGCWMRVRMDTLISERLSLNNGYSSAYPVFHWSKNAPIAF